MAILASIAAAIPAVATTAIKGTPKIGSPRDALPEKTREKIFALEAEADNIRAARGAIFDRLNEAQSDKRAAEARLRELERRSIGRRLDEASGAVIDARARVAAASEAIARANMQLESRRLDAELLALADNVQNYVQRRLPGGVIAAAPAVPAPLKKEETHASAVARIRAEITNLRGQHFLAENAPLPSPIAKKLAREEIERIAARGRPSVFELLEGRQALGWPTRWRRDADTHDLAGGRIRPGAMREESDPFSLLAWLHRDALIAAIEREIDAAGDDENALSNEQRAAKLRELAAKLFEAECVEEAIIDAAARDGLAIARRPDCDPRAVLGLSIDAPEPQRAI